MIEFQNARLADDLFFFRQDHVDVEAPLLYQRFGKDVLRLVDGQPQGRLGNALTQRRALPDLRPRLVGDRRVVRQILDHRVQVLGVGQFVIHHGHFFLQFGRDLEYGREQDKRLRLVTFLQIACKIAQTPYDGWILHVRVKIAQNEERFFVGIADKFQRPQRITQIPRADRQPLLAPRLIAANLDDPLGCRPTQELAPALRSDL